MTLVLVGDDHCGARASMSLEIPYRPMHALDVDASYISVVSTATQYEQIRERMPSQQEVAVIVSAEDCKLLLKLAQENILVFAGIPRKDQLYAVLNDPKRREEHMVTERSKIATARSIENLVSQHSDRGQR